MKPGQLKLSEMAMRLIEEAINGATKELLVQTDIAEIDQLLVTIGIDHLAEAKATVTYIAKRHAQAEIAYVYT